MQGHAKPFLWSHIIGEFAVDYLSFYYLVNQFDIVSGSCDINCRFERVGPNCQFSMYDSFAFFTHVHVLYDNTIIFFNNVISLHLNMNKGKF
jgi:hypothetical protein